WASVPLDNYASDLSAEEQVVMEGFASSCYPSNKPPSPAASSLEYLSDCNSGPLLPQPCGMEESWFVTPPPCFTAECEGPVKVESSPMENLLIEHPSMSVYSSSNPGNNSTMEEITLEGGDQGLPSPPPPKKKKKIQVERRTATHPTAITSQARTLEKVSHIRHIQRAKLRVEKHWLTKSHFQRQNLARECRPRRAKHQGSFVYQPCQRQYNH
uniref:Tumor protein p53 inducible nuclear protein 2 n=1 Tax=Latimeria chalumnae TaxID=7897 RepID=H3BIF2_LATCH